MLKQSLAVLMILVFYNFIAIAAFAQEKPKDQLKNLLKDRYKVDSSVEFVQNELYVGEYDPDMFMKLANMVLRSAKVEMSTQYYHFYEPNPDINKYDKYRWFLKSATPLDDNKTYQVLKGAYGGSPIEPLNEKFRILEMRIQNDGISFYLTADQLRHGGASNTATRGTNGTPDYQNNRVNTTILKGQWGVQYQFIFPKQVIEDGNSEAVLAEINKVLLPTQEAAILKKGKTSKGVVPQQSSVQSPRGIVPQQSSNTRDIEIKIGMTRKQVIDALGQAEKVVKLPGGKEILTYQDFRVVLLSGKVLEVK